MAIVRESVFPTVNICNIQHRYASSSVPLHPDIPWDSIALKYELTGGFIKNAVLSALLRSVSRSSENPVVLEEDIVHGCSLQMRGSLRLRANSDSIVPSHGLDRLILNDNVRKTMESVISFEKARSVLFGQWRFDETMQYAQGTVMLVTGPHGCGKRAVCVRKSTGFQFRDLSCFRGVRGLRLSLEGQ